MQSGIGESVERSTLVSILGNHLLSVSMGSLVTLNEAVYHQIVLVLWNAARPSTVLPLLLEASINGLVLMPTLLL